MNDGQNARQQIVEKIKGSANILVTVSANPSVDQLSSALGLTIILNGMKKHATAVVSGDIPPAITFLEPGKTFENTVDSLRDFIIALDKEKADHLRYKVDGDVVKIFITPYRTTITETDLDFSQGDYNVELVLALGVKDKDHLDGALAAHGRILHDATVATLSCGDEASALGSLDWHDANASSLAEMLVSLTESLKGDKPVLDEQSATALLTGIVAATDRFSNNRTSSKVMTMAAQLMAAGANQQLIAAKLEEAHEIGPDKHDDESDTPNADGTTELNEGESTKLDKREAVKPKEDKKDDGSLAISHELDGSIEEVAAKTAEEHQVEAAKTAEDELANQLEAAGAATGAKPSVDDLQKDLAAASEEVEKAAQPADAVLPPVTPDVGEPTLGGTLNATTEQAREDADSELASDRNKTILTHNSGSYVGDDQPTFQAPFNSVNGTKEEPASVDIFKEAAPTVNLDQNVPSPEPPAPVAPEVTPPPTETLADLDKKNRSSEHADAQAAVAAALEAAPFDPANQAQANIGAQPLGDALHYEETPLASPVTPPAMPPLPPVEPLTPPAAPAGPVDFSVLPPPPPLPPLDAAPQGPLPPEQLGQMFQAPDAPPQPPAPNDPNQFKIPGQ